MRHAIILILTFLITLTVVFIIYRPDIVEDVWLWVIGTAGAVIGWAREGIKAIKEKIETYRKK
jgi:hypothetical protein